MIKFIKGKPPTDTLQEGVFYLHKDADGNLKIGSKLINHSALQWLFYDIEEFISYFTTICFKKYDLVHKESRDVVMKQLRCSPKRLHKVFRGIISELFLEELKPYVHKLCLTSHFNKRTKKRVYQYNFLCVKKLARCLPKIEQLEKDGLFNLAPIVMDINKTPQELKIMFGNNWKCYAKNSFTRNGLMVERGYHALHVPSTILKNIKTLCNDEKLYKLWKISKLYYKDMKQSDVYIYTDMLSMAKSLERNPSPKKWEDVIKLHDRYVKEINKKNAEGKSQEIITFNIPEFIIGQYKCTPLLTEKDIFLEGERMHHCVSMYYHSVELKNYYLTHVENRETSEKSTLGIQLKNKKGFTIDQHHGVCNKETNNREIEQKVNQYIMKQIQKIKEDENVKNNIVHRSNDRFSRHANVLNA